MRNKLYEVVRLNTEIENLRLENNNLKKWFIYLSELNVKSQHQRK